MASSRVSISYKEKMEILDLLDRGEKTRQEISEDYKIATPTLQKILRSRDVVQELGHTVGQRRRIRAPAYQEIEEPLLNWIGEMNSSGTKITGKMIKEQASLIAVSRDILNFPASNGWLDNFRKRVGLDKNNQLGETVIQVQRHVVTPKRRISTRDKEFTDKSGILKYNAKEDFEIVGFIELPEEGEDLQEEEEEEEVVLENDQSYDEENDRITSQILRGEEKQDEITEEPPTEYVDVMNVSWQEARDALQTLSAYFAENLRGGGGHEILESLQRIDLELERDRNLSEAEDVDEVEVVDMDQDEGEGEDYYVGPGEGL